MFSSNGKMLFTGSASKQARCIWSVIRFSCQADAISSSRELSVSATSTASIASGASNSLYGRLSWHASLLYTSALLPSMLLPVNPASTPCTSTFGFRAYHGWHHSSKLRQRAIYSISSLDKLAEVVQKEGNTMDHENLVAVLRLLLELGRREMTKPPAIGVVTSGTVATAVTEASTRAVRQQMVMIADQVAWHVQKRSKWFDPNHAASVVLLTGFLRYTDRHLLNSMTDRLMTRLNEAYSRDLHKLLRGLNLHVKLSSNAHLAAGAAVEAAVQDLAQVQAGQKLSWRQRRRVLVSAGVPVHPYTGPPPTLVEGVERFLLSKIPTGRMPPETLEGLMRYLRRMQHGEVPLNKKLLTVVETDLRVRMTIYSPKILPGLLALLVAEHYPVSLDVLDAAADQFAKHANQASGVAAACFLDVMVTLIKNYSREMASLTQQKAGVAVTNSAEVSSGGSKRLSPGKWIAAHPYLLTQCLKQMTKDMPRTRPHHLVECMAVLIRAEVPFAGLVARGAVLVEAASNSPALSTMTAGVPAQAATTVAVDRPSALVTATDPDAVAAATAAVAFLRAHNAGVENCASRMTREEKAKLRKLYDRHGLPYPKAI